MADSRRGGIEKIAHLFIAGHGASALRARDNSPLHWAKPANSPVGGDGPTTGGPSILPAPQAAAANPNDRAAGAEAPPEELAGEAARAGDAATSADTPVLPADGPAADPKPEASAELQSLLSRAKVVAVLTGHMGPLAGPAAEAMAKGLAREYSRVAMLYGPAEYACLHQFTSGPAGENGESGGNGHHTGGQAASGAHRGNGSRRPCDMLLLPDWVFQFDLWPAGRPVWSIALGYGAGSEGLMAAYGALKGLISRFGRPDEVLVLPFGCNEQEEAWVGERLVEMCRRFLEIIPKSLGEGHPDLRVQSSQLLPIGGGVDGVKQLLESIGKVRLAVLKHPKLEPVEPQNRDEPNVPPTGLEPSDSHDPARSQEQLQPQEQVETGNAEPSAEVTVLVPVPGVPTDGQEVLQALLTHRGLVDGGYFDLWRRSSVAGTVVGSEGIIAAVHSTGDVLAFALWLCRQAQTGQVEELTGITVAVRRPDDWLLEAAQALPVPVTWLRWHPYQLDDRYGLLFAPVEETEEGGEGA